MEDEKQQKFENKSKINEMENEVCNETKLSSCLPGLNLMAVIGVSNDEYFKSLITQLHSKFDRRIPLLGDSDLKKLLFILFPIFKENRFVEVKSLTISVLKHMEKIPQSILNNFIKTKSIYDSLPLEIKRKIWEETPALFHEELESKINLYLSNSKVNRYLKQMYHEKYYLPKSWRKVNEDVKSIVESVGDSKTLYKITLSVLENKHSESFSQVLSSLRHDFTMGVWETFKTLEAEKEFCFTHIQSFDNCLKENKTNSAHFDELKMAVLSVPNDASLVSKISFVSNNFLLQSFLCKEIMARLNHIMKKGTLPRKDKPLKLMADFLLFSLESEKIIKEKVSKYPENKEQLYTVFFPMIIMLLLDEQREKKSYFNPVLREICFDYKVPKRILLYFLLDLFHRNQYERVAEFSEILFDEDCFSFAEEETFINSWRSVFLLKITNIHSQNIKTRLLRPLALFSMYSVAALISCLEIIHFCGEKKVIEKIVLEDLLKLIKEKGIATEDKDFIKKFKLADSVIERM